MNVTEDVELFEGGVFDGEGEYDGGDDHNGKFSGKQEFGIPLGGINKNVVAVFPATTVGFDHATSDEIQ